MMLQIEEGENKIFNKEELNRRLIKKSEGKIVNTWDLKLKIKVLDEDLKEADTKFNAIKKVVSPLQQELINEEIKDAKREIRKLKGQDEILER